MKLTPIDIQQQEFRKGLRGYNPREVSSFLELVSQQLGELARENGDLRSDLRRTRRELEDHRDRETTLKEAMLTAQRAIDEIREQAEKEAQLVMTSAELRAEKLLLDAHQRVGHVVDDIQDLKQQRRRLIEEIRAVLTTHQKILEANDAAAERSEKENEATVMVLDRVRAPTPPPLELSADMHAKSIRA